MRARRENKSGLGTFTNCVTRAANGDQRNVAQLHHHLRIHDRQHRRRVHSDDLLLLARLLQEWLGVIRDCQTAEGRSLRFPTMVERLSIPDGYTKGVERLGRNCD